MEKTSALFEDFTRLAGSAAGALMDVKRELEVLAQSQVERALAAMHLVTRDEFDAVKELAANAMEEAATLRARLDALEAAGAGKPGPKGTKKAESADPA